MLVPGRRGALATAAAGCLIGAVALAGSGPAHAQQGVGGAGPEIHLENVKGKARVSGTLVPNTRETLSITGMPAHSKFLVAMLPPVNQPQCRGNAYLCNPVFPKRFAGAARFMTSGKGRARASFVMPDTYTRAPVVAPESIISAPFHNGDRVSIAAFSLKFEGKFNPVQGFAGTKAIVEAPGS